MNYTELKPADVDYVLVKTTDGGPFVEDVFFLIFSKERYWEIPHTGDKEFLNWLDTFPHVNLEQFIKSMGCAEERLFLLYRGPELPVLSAGHSKALRERLVNLLCENFEADRELLEQIADDIVRQYRASDRNYHNLEHIQNCLLELDSLEAPVNKAALELALWYHDVVYRPGSKTNELESAQKLKNDLGLLNSKINLSLVSQLILAKRSQELSPLEKYFLDIDYSVLGLRGLEYMIYAQNVRLEFSQASYLGYHLKRKAFLKHLLSQPIFFTEEFKQRYETRARTNIDWELAKAPYKFLPTLAWKTG